MSKLKKMLVLFVTAMVIFGLAACGSSTSSSEGDESATKSAEAGGDEIQELTIKISHVVAENTPKHQGALAVKKYIEEKSGGKIKVQVYPNSQLFGDKDEFQNLVANNVQFIIPDMSKMVGNDPGFNIPAMPFLFKDDEAATSFWDGPKGQEILQRLEKDGAIGLTMWPNGAKHITNGKRAIKSPEDLKGLKIRTQGGQLLEAVYEELGAGSTSIPFSELYTALQQKTVDGQSNTFSNIESKKLDEVQKYMTVMGHTRVDYTFMTNKKFWDSLNDATKEIVQGGVDEGTKVAREQALSLNEDALKLLKERGKIEIYELSDDEIKAFQEALQPLYDKWGEKIGQDTLDAAMNQ